MGFVIVGMTDPSYIPINLKADAIKLSSVQLQAIDQAYADLEKKIRTDFGVSIREFRGLNEKYY